MSLRRIKHTLLRMSTEEKVIGLGALMLVVGSFMPWHSVFLTIDQKENISNAFSGDIGVIGFVVNLMNLMTLIYLLAEHVQVRMPQFGYKKSQILFFLTGESFFLILLTLAIYTKRSIEFTSAGMRFGIYISLVGAFLAAFAAFAKVQKVKEKQVKNFFHQEEAGEDKDMITEGEMDEEQGLKPMYFGEDKTGPVISPAFQASKPEAFEPFEQNEGGASGQTHQAPNHQAGFFSKEAGLK